MISNQIDLNGNLSGASLLSGSISGDSALKGASSKGIIETDPTVPQYIKNITQDDITNWNEKATIEDMTQYIDANKETLRGEKGEKGDKGDTGAKGEDGYTPIKGVDYFDGKDGANGTNGKDGADGEDGYTPVKGKDYYTEADKQEMVNLVIAALPSSEDVSY